MTVTNDTTPATTTAPVKEIRYNRQDRDFAYLWNGEADGIAMHPQPNTHLPMSII